MNLGKPGKADGADFLTPRKMDARSRSRTGGRLIHIKTSLGFPAGEAHQQDLHAGAILYSLRA